MKVSPLGKKHSTGQLIFEPIDRVEFAKEIDDNYGKTIDKGKGISDTISTFAVTRGLIEHKAGLDIGNPREAGWTFLISEDEPLFEEIKQAIRPLADYRGMTNPDRPIIFRSGASDDWKTWVEENLVSDPITDKPPPHYLLIVGSPELVPFEFQSMLSIRCCTGRLDIDNKIENLQTYVKKVIDIEKGNPIVTDNTVIFATDEGVNRTGCSDPTYYSHNYMAKPISRKLIQNQLKFKTNELMAEKATKQNLLDFAKKSNPCLVFTASHGTSPEGEKADVREKYTGAIVCDGFRDSKDEQTSLITVDDIPQDSSFVEGGIFFQFGCFSYGAPSISDVMELVKTGGWGGLQYAPKSYVSPIPKKLLFNPHGPLAFIGHLDVTLLNSFTDPKNPSPDGEYDPRIDPLFTMMRRILNGDPVGLAITGLPQETSFANRRSLADEQFRRLYNYHQLKKISDDDYFPKLADTYLDSADAKNYLIFGDPAVSMKIMTT